MKQFKLILSILALALCVNVYAYKKQPIDITVNGQSRNMIVFTPDVLPDGVPLMIITHGMNQDPEYQFGSDKMYELIDAEKFVIAYPRSNGSTWDTGGDSDKNFILKIIDDMQSRYGIDTNRVYWSGFSMGSMLIYHCMPTMLDKIAAFAPTSGIQFSEQPWNNCKKPVNLIQCHAYGDDVFPLDQYDVRSYVMHFKDVDKTTSYKKTSGYRTYSGAWYDGDKEVWSGGTNGSEVELFLFNNGGHWPMDGNKTEIWNFCKRFSLDPNVPNATIVSPKADDHYTRVDTVDVAIEATDKDGYVTSIVLYVDGSVRTRETFTEVAADGKYLLNYRWARPSKGNHTLRVVVTDNDQKTREVSRTVTIDEADPLALVAVDPEDDSFDLTTDVRTFHLTFSYPVNCDKLRATMRVADGTRYFAVQETGFNREVTMVLPDTVVINEGRRTINITGIVDNRDITMSMQTLHYVYGYTDPYDSSSGSSSSRKTKKALMDALAEATQLYGVTAQDKYSYTNDVREPLHDVIEQYTDFQSTSPTEWKAATAVVQVATDTLQARKDQLDLYYQTRQTASYLIDTFADNPDYNQMREYRSLCTAYNSILCNLADRHMSNPSKIADAISRLQEYIDKFLAKIPTAIRDVTDRPVRRQTSVMYNMQGTRVGAGYHGIVIMNGKKYLR